MSFRNEPRHPRRMRRSLILCCALTGLNLLPVCGTPHPAPETAAFTAVAIVDWQFPVEQPPTLSIPPLQRRWLAEAVPFAPALYPNLSEASKAENPHALARLTKHGSRCARAYAAGRSRFNPPFLLNASVTTPAAVQALIRAGVRIFCLSIASNEADSRLLQWTKTVATEHPDVLLVVSTPHISGNSISVEQIAELPSILAIRGQKNVLLVGVLQFYDDTIRAHREGHKAGTAANPFYIDNQPAGANAQQVFMLNDRSTREFVEGFSGTSAAAPHLASLLGLLAEDLVRSGHPTPLSADVLLKSLDAVLHRAEAKQKTGEVHGVSYFTLDTILRNAVRPLITSAIWGDLIKDAPAPRLIRNSKSD